MFEYSIQQFLTQVRTLENVHVFTKPEVEHACTYNKKYIINFSPLYNCKRDTCWTPAKLSWWDWNQEDEFPTGVANRDVHSFVPSSPRGKRTGSPGWMCFSSLAFTRALLSSHFVPVIYALRRYDATEGNILIWRVNLSFFLSLASAKCSEGSDR